MSLTRTQVHALTPFAKVHGTTVTYPAENAEPAKKKTGSKRRSEALSAREGK